MMNVGRILTKKLALALEEVPAVALLGPRQVGKTTLARELHARIENSIFLDLERPTDRQKLQEAEMFLSQYMQNLVILDEVQRVPDLFSVLRPLIDQRRVPGRFLILGSASPELLKQTSESLAGRIRFLELTPFLIQELPGQDWRKLWLRGGFPESYLVGDAVQSLDWRENFIRTYLERDVPQLGIGTPAESLRLFFSMVAHSHGQLWNASKIAGSLGNVPATVTRYLDIAQQSYLLARIPPFHANLKKRLVKSPKVYFRDSGLLHSFLGIESFEDLIGNPAAGNSFEGFVLEQLHPMRQNSRWDLYFFRTAAGAEIDFILSKGQRRIAVEVKFSLTPKLSKGFWNAFADLECERAYVIYPGTDRFPIAANVEAIPVTQIHTSIELD